MEIHWWCCECDATNSSPDDVHLVCSRKTCDHHLCSDCYNPQQIGRDRHLNAQVVTTRTSHSKSIVNDRKRAKHERVFRKARELIGKYIQNSKIGKAFLKFWSYFQEKTGNISRVKAWDYVVIPPNSESLPSTSNFYQSEEITEYTQEAYYY